MLASSLLEHLDLVSFYDRLGSGKRGRGTVRIRSQWEFPKIRGPEMDPTMP